MLKRMSGLTLLEVILVMVIASSLLLLGIKQYENFKMQSSFLDVRKNVDVLFQALGQYYQANCRSLSDQAVAYTKGSTPTTLQGDLAPGGVIKDYKVSNQLVTINIQNKLIEKHFLTENWLTPAPLVDESEGEGGYIASFLFLLTTKQEYACWNFTNTAGKVSCNTALYYPNDPDVGPQTIRDNQVAYWLVQVAVKIADDPSGIKTLAFVGPAGASCASGVPDACDGSKKPQYLIWQRLPTKAASRVNSDLWVSQQQEAVFNQQYTHDVMYEMATPNYAPSDSTLDTNYLCGN